MYRNYKMHREWFVKPVRNLSRKHTYPNNIEKMNARCAEEVLAPDATLEVLTSEAEHCSHSFFPTAGPTIIFMKNIYRWFILHAGVR